MTDKQKPTVTVPKEKAVFKLDKDGHWRNIDGEPFANKRIIRYFHSSIKKDEGGYFLQQEHPHFIDKVYFPYEDTALFVSRIIKGKELTLCLNTGERMTLEPGYLVQKGDNLYVENGQHRIKLSENALLTLAGYMEEDDGRYVLNIGGKTHPIPAKM